MTFVIWGFLWFPLQPHVHVQLMHHSSNRIFASYFSEVRPFLLKIENFQKNHVRMMKIVKETANLMAKLELN